MDHFNDRIRSWFDFLGGKTTTKVHKATAVPAKTKTITRNGSKLTTKSHRSKSRVSSKASLKKRKSVDSGSTNSKSTSSLANVFAPRLLHMASIPTEGTPANTDTQWISVKAMAANRLHCAVYLIHCAEHNKVVVTTPSQHQAMWMPFTPIPSNRSWEESGLTGLLIILSGADTDLLLKLKEQLPFTERHLTEVFEIQIPHTLDIVSRLIWYVRIDQRVVKSAHFKCCQDTKWLQWIDAKDIAEQTPSVIEYMWGSEMMETACSVAACYQTKQTPCSTLVEYGLDMAFKYLPRTPPVDNEQQLLCSASLSEKDIERLYGDFLDHCFPAIAMSIHSFKVYMTKYGLQYNDERLWAYFRAFNFNQNGVITFPELLLGLACIDSKSVHNETRAKFVVRYYDVYHRGYLSEDVLRLMIQEMNTGEVVTEDVVEAKLAEVLRDVETEEDPDNPGKLRIHQRRFLSAIGAHKIRGTSKLCRIGKQICVAIASAIFARKQRNRKMARQLGNVVDRQHLGTCIGCRGKRPVLDESLIKISTDGFYIDRVKMALGHPPQPGSSLRIRSRESQKSTEKSKKSSKTSLQTSTSLSSVEGISVQDPIVSVTTANEEALNVAINLIRSIRQFAPNKGTTANPLGLLAASNSERQSFLYQMEVIERAYTPMLKNRRWVPVPSPTYIIGDIHGNLDDLLTLERHLWKRFPFAGPSMVFLGDMVDRGKWSVECATYLLCLAVIAPHKVILLRGNHEVRSLQCNYSYRWECINKYDEELGLKLWELTNRIFDHLPLCAVVDAAVYCAHGGIPRSTYSLADIATLPAEIVNPEIESPIAHEIIWSDPLAQPQFVESARLQQLDIATCEGYLPNRKRGTAFVFNEEAINRFFEANSLSHVVRAHEVPATGFFFHFDKKCATIFSCSHYCNNSNECAVMFVDRDRIRVVRIDTSNNASATDG